MASGNGPNAAAVAGVNAPLRVERSGRNAPEEALKNRSTVCAGSSRLFRGLAAAAGLEAVTIEGYAKGFAYAPPLRPAEKP
ncbi:MAG: hypothetical protein ACM3XS_00250 [Bacteroidota bacterium]